jgi:hypothetical protein
MRIEVKYRDSHHCKAVPARIVHERVSELQRRHGGIIEPKQLVDDARPARSPLHPAFEWNDSVAAEAHRENQARQLIRSVVVIQYDDDENESARVDPAFVSVARPFEESSGYTETESAMSDPAVRASIIEVAKGQLAGWVKRHRHLEELAELAIVIERELAATAKAKTAKRKTSKNRVAARA